MAICAKFSLGGVFARLYDGCDSGAECLGLFPAAVCKGWIVGGGRGEVPLGVCCVQSGTVSIAAEASVGAIS